MKLVVAMIAACTAFSISQKVHAYPASNAVSTRIAVSTSGLEPGRQFISGRDDTNAVSGGCSDSGVSPDCSLDSTHCAKVKRAGWYPNGHQCCYDVYICRPDGTIDPELAAKADAVEASTEALGTVFTNNDDQTRSSYWGYINSTSKSPSAGRSNAPWAQLDACMGNTQVDTYTNMGSLADNSQCRTDCDNSTKNPTCQGTATENGNSSQTNATCKDRCDCWMNAAYGKSYNCEGL